MPVIAAFWRLLMIYDFEFVRQHQWVLKAFDGEIVQHHVERDEYFSLLLSRRTVERCDDELAFRRGLFDRRSGDLFDIDESELLLRR